MKTSHHKRVLATLAALGVTMAATSALALDAYRDRKGLFYGATVGFGVAKSDTSTAPDAKNQVGLDIGGRVGGGLTSELTLDLEIAYMHQLDPGDGIFTGFVAGEYFLVDGLYVKAMGGMAYLRGDNSSSGFGAGAGLGYEFFANSDLAVGVGADAQHHFYDEFGVNLFNFGLSFTMY